MNFQVIFFQTFGTEEAVARMVRLATEAHHLRKLHKEAQLELSAAKAEACSLRSEIGRQCGVCQATKSKCDQMLDELRVHWQEKFAKKVAELEREFEDQVVEKEKRFEEVKGSIEARNQRLETKVRRLEIQLAVERNSRDFFNQGSVL